MACFMSLTKRRIVNIIKKFRNISLTVIIMWWSWSIWLFRYSITRVKTAKYWVVMRNTRFQYPRREEVVCRVCEYAILSISDPLHPGFSWVAIDISGMKLLEYRICSKSLCLDKRSMLKSPVIVTFSLGRFFINKSNS